MLHNSSSLVEISNIYVRCPLHDASLKLSQRRRPMPQSCSNHAGWHANAMKTKSMTSSRISLSLFFLVRCAPQTHRRITFYHAAEAFTTGVPVFPSGQRRRAHDGRHAEHARRHVHWHTLGPPQRRGLLRWRVLKWLCSPHPHSVTIHFVLTNCLAPPFPFLSTMLTRAYA